MRWYRTWILPGLVFQSMIIGGGYGTGRELVEFFLQGSPRAGIFGMAVATVIWSVVLGITFELARRGRLYDYRSFLSSLLGRAWVAYEIVYLIGLILVVSVLGSAAGVIASQMTGLPEIAGNSLVILAVGVLAFFGSGLIERVMSIWSLALYAVFGVVVVLTLNTFSSGIGQALQAPVENAAWLADGAAYAAYNVGLVPAILFVTRHLQSQRQALLSGALAGLLAMLPGALIFVAMLAQYPQVVSESVPSDYLLASLGYPWLRLAFQIILFGTFIETGVSLVHGFNERLAGVLDERGRRLSGRARGLIAGGMLIVALFVADAVGLVSLIASGYGALTWGYWIVFVLPVLSIGLWRLTRPYGVTETL